ncbi:MAG: autoinducer binding domain-containing protein [Alphaproteobacteria bacterium]|nr:autoinducer binding domain-containing protein [Alphaproteobacteria bacterium]
MFAPDWVDHYTLSGHALSDPLLRWCQKSEGIVRWSDVECPYTSDVLLDYKAYGYRYGTVVSIRGTSTQPKGSLGVFARKEREPSDAEMAEIRRIISELHADEPRQMTKAQLEALRLYAQGFLQKQIAHELNISVGAVKARLRGGADRLNVKTSREAALIAASRGLQ